MVESLMLGGKRESAILRLIDVDLRHSIFVDIIVSLQQIYC